MANELPAKSQIATIRDLLNKSKQQIAMALPKHMSPDRMLRMAMTSIQRNPRLLECTQASLIGCVIQSAQLGLELDDVRGEAYLIPFRDTRKQVVVCTFVAGYKGLIKLAINSGFVRKIEPRAVYEGDDFDYGYGDQPFIKHKPAPSKTRGKLTHAYAVAKFRDGTTQFLVLDRDEIDEHRAKSKSRGDDSAWNNAYEPMAMKTTVRVLTKYIPASPELQMAAALDERAEEGLPQDLEAVYTEILGEDDGNDKSPTGNLTKLAENMKQEEKLKPEEKKAEPPKTPPAEEKKVDAPRPTGGRLF
jgi:recombination protein RecT